MRVARVAIRGVAVAIALSLSALWLEGCAVGSSNAGYESLTVEKALVHMVPAIQAGNVGWCTVIPLKTASCGGRTGTPVLVESWYGDGQGYALVSANTYSLTVDGQQGIKTGTSDGLVNGLRSVAVKLVGLHSRLQSGFVAEAQNGKPIRNNWANQALLSHEPTRTIRSGSEMRVGPCVISARAIARLQTLEAKEVTSVAPRHMLVEPSFLSCASVLYKLGGWRLVAGVLVDAVDPGAKPASLPGMHRVSGKGATYEGAGIEGEVLAQRLSNCWLVVSGGKADQRRELLSHLRVEVDL